MSSSSEAEWQSESDDEEAEGHDTASEQQQQQKRDEDGTGSSVVCVTADYAMQNMILQMACACPRLMAGQITRTRRWVLRCTACSQVSKVVRASLSA